MMSSHMALPKEGNIEQLIKVFTYIKTHQNAEICFEPSDPVVEESRFYRKDRTSSEFGHVEVTEDLTP